MGLLPKLRKGIDLVEESRKKLGVLMVCMGNICRSPTAEGVLRHKLRAAGLQERVSVASAGTHGDYHQGEPPDSRSSAHAARRGYALDGHQARPVSGADFECFDLILAMDEANLDWLRAHPAAQHGKLGLLLDYAPAAGRRSVPDPYYGSAAGFEVVLDLVESACDGLVEHLRKATARQGGTS